MVLFGLAFFFPSGPIKAAFTPTSTLRGYTQRGFKGREISIQETWCQAFLTVTNSTSFMEETDSNPGEGNEGKEVVLRQRLLGSFAVSGSLSGHRYQMEPADR